VSTPGPEGQRVGLVAAELSLSPVAGARGTLQEGFVFDWARVPVAVRPHAEGAPPPTGALAFTVDGPSGDPLLDAVLDPDAVDAARANWRRHVHGVAALAGVLALLAAAIPLRRALAMRGWAWGVSLATVLVARGTLWVALPVDWRGAQLTTPLESANWLERFLLRSPLDALLSALAAAGVATALAEAASLWRLRWRARTHEHTRGAAMALVAGGAVAAACLLVSNAVLDSAVARGSVTAVQLSLTPLEFGRLALLSAIVLGHAVAVWLAALALAAAAAPWRMAWNRRLGRVVFAAAGLLPSLILPLVWELRSPSSRQAIALSAVVAVALAWMHLRGFRWYRHSSYGRQLISLAAVLVAPALTLYPALWSASERTRERLVSDTYAMQALKHPEDLQHQLAEALAQIDRQPGLRDLVESAPEPADELRPEAAFALWQGTVLGASRLTSAIEVYGTQGRLVSRFALNFPEYGAVDEHHKDAGCQWNIFGEAAPFGAEERRMLHAERAVCGPTGREHGTIVVHVMLDYDALPFISSQSPYFEFFTQSAGERAAAAARGGFRLVVYGWGRTPVYASGSTAWVMDDALFSRIYHSRDPVWTEIAASGTHYKVLLVNDRYGVYAVGYPRPTAFDHAVQVAELATLALLIFVVLGAGTMVVRRLARPSVWPAWQVVREVRTSFSRKLFLAFVAASIVPVVVLAVAIRAYVAGRLRADVEAEAGRTAAVARRVAEEMLAAQRGGEASLSALTDDTMVWISRVIQQDVNIFVNAQLVATSERDLYASGLLPTRIPGRAYRAIVLHRLPAFVGEDQIADLRYLMAAAPIRMREVDAVLTVPLALQQREIEREIAELDRGVQLGAMLFILLGAGVGYWLAARISDPVERLTLASRRIAAGELSARVFVRTADELQRLVEAFNTMAVELERQRAQLEHTNRLEAWAEMARQVAHDIKNPLTPIQLSAEHLRRVHRDRGEPLSPVLERCVDTILAQVRLLRRISAEFSSFAATPIVSREPADLGALVREVAESYRAGLDDRYVFELAVPPDLPMVDLDRLLVGRAIVNVIENALYAMPTGGHLAVSVTCQDDHVAIRVADTGVGMDDKARARVFEPYFSTKTTGTGLGLPIAKRNIELHGGSVSVDSRPGAGTVVTLVLPVRTATETDGGRPRSEVARQPEVVPRQP
jgi:signal transduction histidine kinase